jgi:Taurine catabolism dioxygenase TauD, TfdA family
MGDLIIGLGHAYMTCDQLFGLDESFNVQPQMAAGHELSDDGFSGAPPSATDWCSTRREGVRNRLRRLDRTHRRFVYAHVWRQWNLVMWDNRVTMHRAHPFDNSELRDMHRTTVACEQSTMEQAAQGC